MLGGWGFRLIITGFKSCKYLLTLLCLWETCKNKHRVELELKKKVFGEAFCLSGDTECLHCTWNLEQSICHDIFSPGLCPFPLS